MLRIGCWILTTWAALNLVASLKVVIDTLFLGGHTPALFLLLTEADIQALSPDVLATMDSIAVFANGLNIAFCLLALLVIWRALFNRHRWGFGGLLLGFLVAWGAGTAADGVVGFAAPWVNVVSLGMLGVGFFFAGFGFFKKEPLH